MAEDIQQSEAKDPAHLALGVLHGTAWACGTSYLTGFRPTLRWLKWGGQHCGRALPCAGAEGKL